MRVNPTINSKFALLFEILWQYKSVFFFFGGGGGAIEIQLIYNSCSQMGQVL